MDEQEINKTLEAARKFHWMLRRYWKRLKMRQIREKVPGGVLKEKKNNETMQSQMFENDFPL